MDSVNQEGPFDNEKNGVPPQDEHIQQAAREVEDTALPKDDAPTAEDAAPRTHYTQQSATGYGAKSDNSATEPTQAPAAQKPAATQPTAKSASLFAPTNLPPQPASPASEDLNKEEMNYLRKLSDQNYAIIKKLKKVKQARPMTDARTLNRVRKLYSMNFARRYYGFPPKQVKKLRDRLGTDILSAFGSAAQRTKRMVIILVLIVAILATVGTGAIVAIMAYNSNNNNIYIETDRFIIIAPTQDTSGTLQTIDNYILGAPINYAIKIRNETGKDLNVRFRIMLEPTGKFKDDVENNVVNPGLLTITYEYDHNVWEYSDGYLYYKGGNTSGYGVLEKAADYGGGSATHPSNVQVISGFSLDIDSFEESNKWVNYTATLAFVFEFNEAGSA